MKKNLSRWGLIVFLVTSFGYGNNIPPELESTYSEAVLQFHSKHYDEALKMLDSMLKTSSKVVALLELKGLVLKAQGKWDDAFGTYRLLVDAQGRGPEAEKARAPYYFEMGMVRFRQGKYREAAGSLEKSLKQNFNVVASHYALGISLLQDNKPILAEPHLVSVINGDVEELKPPTHLSLAQVNSMIGDGRGAIRETVRARLLASNAMNSMSDEARPMAKQVLASSEKFLKQLDHDTFQASVGISTGYDSNVLLIPTTSAGTTAGGTNQASLTTAANWEADYATTPVGESQWSVSYNGSVNYNLNQQTRAGEYLSNVFTAQYTQDNNQTFSYGGRVQGLFNMRYGDDNTAIQNTLYLYNLTGTVGPFARYEYSPRNTIGGELFFAPAYYFQDSAADAAYRLTGPGVQGRLFWAQQTTFKYWNPQLSVSGSWTMPSGTEFRVKSFTASLNNTLKMSDKVRVIPQGSMGFSLYTDRADGQRQDTTFIVGLGVQYTVSPELAINANASYTMNTSSVPDTYSFYRGVGSIGANYYF